MRTLLACLVVALLLAGLLALGIDELMKSLAANNCPTIGCT